MESGPGLWERVRKHQFWGLTIVAWWFIIRGAGFVLAFSFALTHGSGPDALLMIALYAAIFLGTGVRLRRRDPVGWWSAVFVFAFQLSMMLAGNLSSTFEVLLGRATPGQANMVDSILWQTVVPFLVCALPIVYLTHPKVKKQFLS